MSRRPLPDAAGEHAAVACLAALPHMTTCRLSSLLSAGTPADALAVIDGAPPPPGPVESLARSNPEVFAQWRRAARATPPSRWIDILRDSGTEVVRPGDAAFPPQLLDDPRAPAALFVRGRIEVLDARRVGIVGTRNATRPGRETAAEFGYELSRAGVVVVSGLALGVDGAAHRGVLRACAGDDAEGAGPPVAVVGSGPDVVYPRRHRALWDEVGRHGAVISEWPPGTRPDAFRFPLRNRLLAALSELLVVVESRERGGSLITAREAAERGIDVFAVPGARHSPASAGTNRLLRDGAAPATEVDDLLVALGLDHRRAGTGRFDTRPSPRGLEADVLEECRGGPVTVDVIVSRLGVGLAEAALALARLERDGWVSEAAGWFEPSGVWSTP